MPTYEYKCPRCGTEFEAVQKMTAKPGAKCPACGGKAERQLSASSFVFKGSGFYLTDYGRAGQKSRSDAHERGGEKPAAEKPAADKSVADKPAADKPEKSPAPAKPKKKDH